jgi:hypothetical protein
MEAHLITSPSIWSHQLFHEAETYRNAGICKVWFVATAATIVVAPPAPPTMPLPVSQSGLLCLCQNNYRNLWTNHPQRSNNSLSNTQS